jgi:pimeloyl-ACP methyl ester carboxylesterase
VRTELLEVGYFELGPYADLERQLAALPPVAVPAVTLGGFADGNFPATDGTSGAAHFTGPRHHHQIPLAGHDLPQEAPDAFAAAVLEARSRALRSHRV